MAKRRTRSLSLFQPNHNSTADRLEGLIESDEDSKEIIPAVYMDEEDVYYGTEEDVIFPNGPPTINTNSREMLFTELEFVKAIKLQNDVKKRENFKKTLGRIKANQIEGLSKEDFIAKFMALKKRTDKFRTLYSMIDDMEIYLTKLLKKNPHPDKPIPPPQPMILFMKELKAKGKHCPPNLNYLKWVGQLFSQLSVRDKSSYVNKYELLMLNYNQKLKEFYEKYPDERPIRKRPHRKITPFSLFFDNLKQKDIGVKRTTALEHWKNLPIKQKVSYIKEAYQYQTEESGKVIITVKEKVLLDEHLGKPERPPAGPYYLFLQDNANQPESHIKYKTLNAAEKRSLKERLHDMWVEYERRYVKYIKKLPSDVKDKEQEEMLKILAKHKTGNRVLKRNSSESPAEKEAAEDVVPKKKRKSENVSEEDSTLNDKIVNKANNTKAKKSTLKEKRILNEIPAASTKPEKIPNKSPKKAAPLLNEPEKVLVKKEKKETKKPKTDKIAFTESIPPKSAFKYFISINSFNSLSKAKKHYRKLSSSEKKNIKKAYKARCKSYINKLREYLTSLEKTEMEAFVKELERKKEEESDGDDDSSSENESVSGSSSDASE